MRKVETLLAEVDRKLESLQTGDNPDTDWNRWNEVAGELRTHLEEQLSVNTDKFSGNLQSFDLSHEAIILSVQKAKERLG